jgi:predicted Rossmann-fold nucleotide-binding protein
MKVSIFAGMGDGTPNMVRHAREIGGILGRGGHTMVQGGYMGGIMGAALKEFQNYSDDVEIVIPKRYAHEMVGVEYKKLHLTESLSGRIDKFMELGDLSIALAGGMGTFHEILCAAEMKKAGEARADVAVLNTDGYFNGLYSQINAAKRGGFVPKDRSDIKFFKSPMELYHEVLAGK